MAPGLERTSGYQLVLNVFSKFGDTQAVERLLRCAKGDEREFLELKASVNLRPEDCKTKNSQKGLYFNIAECAVAIANTSGGVLIIGLEDDGETLVPLGDYDNEEKFLREKIMQRLFPEQRVWTEENGNQWGTTSLPEVDPVICPYRGGKVVVLKISPQPIGSPIVFSRRETGHTHERLLVQRKPGIGKNDRIVDPLEFEARDLAREIERTKFADLWRKLAPEEKISSRSGSSGVYRLKPVHVDGGASIDEANEDVENLLKKTEGHRLAYVFGPGTRISGYEIVERLGEGGMGVVYKVRRPFLSDYHALKVLKISNPGGEAWMYKKRFLLEALLMQSVQSKVAGLCRYIPTVEEVGWDEKNDCLFFCMQLVCCSDGKSYTMKDFTLSEKMAREEGLTRIDDTRARKWLRQICWICKILHEAQVVHRDIKLTNLLVNKNDDVVLSDFGIARVLNPDLRKGLGYDVTVTSTQGNRQGAPGIGTPYYLAPELQWEGAKATPKSDVWAIGIVFFRLLTGEWFRGQQFVKYAWCNGVWGRLFEGMLENEVDARFNCADVLRVLDADLSTRHLCNERVGALFTSVGDVEVRKWIRTRGTAEDGLPKRGDGVRVQTPDDRLTDSQRRLVLAAASSSTVRLAGPGSGNTTTALNLALQLSGRGESVILIVPTVLARRFISARLGNPPLPPQCYSYTEWVEENRPCADRVIVDGFQELDREKALAVISAARKHFHFFGGSSKETGPTITVEELRTRFGVTVFQEKGNDLVPSLSWVSCAHKKEVFARIFDTISRERLINVAIVLDDDNDIAELVGWAALRRHEVGAIYRDDEGEAAKVNFGVPNIPLVLTYQNLKGLEFDTVFLVFFHGEGTTVSSEELQVALTRTRGQVHVCSVGPAGAHPDLEAILRRSKAKPLSRPNGSSERRPSPRPLTAHASLIQVIDVEAEEAEAAFRAQEEAEAEEAEAVSRAQEEAEAEEAAVVDQAMREFEDGSW